MFSSISLSGITLIQEQKSTILKTTTLCYDCTGIISSSIFVIHHLKSVFCHFSQLLSKVSENVYSLAARL